jgi:hypothetical protein
MSPLDAHWERLSATTKWALARRVASSSCFSAVSEPIAVICLPGLPVRVCQNVDERVADRLTFGGRSVSDQLHPVLHEEAVGVVTEPLVEEIKLPIVGGVGAHFENACVLCPIRERYREEQKQGNSCALPIRAVQAAARARTFSSWVRLRHSYRSDRCLEALPRYHSTLNPKMGSSPTFSIGRRLSGNSGSTVNR